MTVFIIESDVNTVAWLRPCRGAIDSRARLRKRISGLRILPIERRNL